MFGALRCPVACAVREGAAGAGPVDFPGRGVDRHHPERGRRHSRCCRGAPPAHLWCTSSSRGRPGESLLSFDTRRQWVAPRAARRRDRSIDSVPCEAHRSTPTAPPPKLHSRPMRNSRSISANTTPLAATPSRRNAWRRQLASRGGVGRWPEPGGGDAP